MVRTKQVRKKSSFAKRKTQSTVNKKVSSQTSTDDVVYSLVSKEYESHADFTNTFNSFYDGELKMLKKSYEQACSYIKKLVLEKLQSYPESVRSCNINAIDFNLQDQNENPNIAPPPVTVRQSRSRKSTEVFDFKRPKTPRLPSRSSSRKSSSSSGVSSSSSTGDKFKTPLMTSRMMKMGKMGQTITPKIYSNTPISVMRRPHLGEMAVSLTGSPLMVGSVTCEEVPTVNVPLMDGRVFSIMPEEGVYPPDLPDFDEKTKEYLRTLQAHLALLAPRTP